MGKRTAKGAIDDGWRISSTLWERMQPLLPPERVNPRGGRSWVPLDPCSPVSGGIFYVLRTGCQWKALSRCFGAASTVHDRFQEWRANRAFARLWKAGLVEYDTCLGLDWEWQNMDEAVTIDGANRHDMKLVGPTLEAIVVKRPLPTPDQPQHLCMDKGYDFPEIRELVAAWGCTAHIKSRGQEVTEKRSVPGYRAWRWVVERTSGDFLREVRAW